MDISPFFTVASIVFFVGWCVMMFVAGSTTAEERWKKETIRRGLALYDPVTGKWRWKDEEPKS